MVRSLSLLLLLLIGAAGAQTRPPVTYVLDYGPNHLTDAGYLATVASSPPHLLHLGKDVPMTHNWGPIQALGGENQAYGTGEHVRLLTPDEVDQRIAELTGLVDGLHRAGVQCVMPYVCLMTLAGHTERRTGFWELYDQWDAYGRFGLGPRPDDPAGWLQRTATGEPLQFYAYQGDHYPRYEPNHRYAASIQAAGWRQWQETVIRLIARCGYDGVFVDNGLSERDESELSQRLYRAWLAGRFDREKVLAAHGVERLEDVRLVSRGEGPAALLSQRFWFGCIADHYRRLQVVANQARGRRFALFANGGRRHGIKHALAEIEWMMYERTHGSFGTNSGLVRVPLTEDLSAGQHNRHIADFLYPQAVGRRVRALVLTRPGYPQRVREWMMNPAAAELGMAEACAFSGGGGYLLRPDWGLFGEVMGRYRRFIDEHQALYDRLEPTGRVAVALFADQTAAGHQPHEPAAEAALDVVGSLGVPAMLVTEETCALPDALAAYSLLVLPEVKYLPAATAAGLARYLECGGQLVVVGEPPRVDEWGQPSPLADALASSPATVRLAVPDDLAELPVMTELALVTGQTPPQRDAVRTMVYRDPREPRWLVHLVNYDVVLGDQVNAVRVQQGLRLRFPAAWRVRAVMGFSTDARKPERCTVGADGSLVVPPLRIYQVYEVLGR